MVRKLMLMLGLAASLAIPAEAMAAHGGGHYVGGHGVYHGGGHRYGGYYRGYRGYGYGYGCGLAVPVIGCI
jgi:hypothetical protein